MIQAWSIVTETFLLLQNRFYLQREAEVFAAMVDSWDYPLARTFDNDAGRPGSLQVGAAELQNGFGSLTCGGRDSCTIICWQG